MHVGGDGAGDVRQGFARMAARGLDEPFFALARVSTALRESVGVQDEQIAGAETGLQQTLAAGQREADAPPGDLQIAGLAVRLQRRAGGWLPFASRSTPLAGSMRARSTVAMSPGRQGSEQFMGAAQDGLQGVAFEGEGAHRVGHVEGARVLPTPWPRASTTVMCKVPSGRVNQS